MREFVQEGQLGLSRETYPVQINYGILSNFIDTDGHVTNQGIESIESAKDMIPTILTFLNIHHHQADVISYDNDDREPMNDLHSSKGSIIWTTLLVFQD